MVLHLQTAVEDADHGKDCKTGTRNQRGLISNSDGENERNMPAQERNTVGNIGRQRLRYS